MTTSSRSKQSRVVPVVLMIYIALALTLLVMHEEGQHFRPGFIESWQLPLHRDIMEQRAGNPWQYRILVPYAQEGVIQVFYPEIGSQWIVGVVGQLQLDVLISRLEAEYKVEAVLEPSPFDTARWLSGPDAALKGFVEFNRSNLAKDRDGNLVFMAKSAWDVGYQQERNPDVKFSATRER